MAEDVPTINTSRLPASEVARRSFSTSRRGFDTEEVRAFLEQVSRELLAAEKREQELLHELAAAEERARHPVIDEAVLTSALGQRSGAVLRHAHEEAARIAQQAEEAAAVLLRDAQQQATETDIRAESSAAERIAESELAANALRQQARDEAAAVLDTARAEGEALMERAREHGRAMVEQAQEARRRVLADMAHRRRMMTDQIEQFRAARDEIAGSVVGVRNSVDRILEELSRADDAARAAAADAARHQGVEADERTLVEEAEHAAAEIGVGTGLPVGTDPTDLAGLSASRRQVALRFDDVAVVVESPPTDELLSPVVDVPTAGTGRLDDDLADARVRPRSAGAGAPPASGPDEGFGEHQADVEGLFARLRARQDDERHDAAVLAPEPDSSGGDWAQGSPAVSELARAPRTDSTPVQAAREEHDPAGSHLDTPPAGVVVAGAYRETPAAGEAEVAAAKEGEPAEAEGGDAEEQSPEAAAVARRDEVVEPIVTAMARRLKRALQDDQNRMLDRLRQGTGEWTDDLLLDEAAQRSLYVKASVSAVRDAAAAGIAFARSFGGGRQGRAPAPDAATVDTIADDLASTVVTLLRRRLSGTEMPDAAERIGAAYREWRGERIEQLAKDRALDAFGAGVLVGSGRFGGVRWVRGGDGPGCADCEDNALAGRVVPGEEFPTGHVHPPAHAGCGCLVLPTPS